MVIHYFGNAFTVLLPSNGLGVIVYPAVGVKGPSVINFSQNLPHLSFEWLSVTNLFSDEVFSFYQAKRLKPVLVEYSSVTNISQAKCLPPVPAEYFSVTVFHRQNADRLFI
jgi:hypothetical protein